MSLQGTNMEINGLNLNVLVEGEGEPVLLLHGFPAAKYRSTPHHKPLCGLGVRTKIAHF